MFKFLKKLLPEAYVICENPDKTEIGVTSKKGYLAQPKLQFDVNDRPMKIMHTIYAYSWTSAMKKYHKLYDLGPYKPF